MEYWCILRTAAGRTLALARSLAEAGIAAWTPEDVQVRRRPRSHVEREVVLPLVPGLVFAPVGRLDELIAMSRSPALTYQAWDSEKRRFVTRGYPYFTVYLEQGRCPRLTDRDLKGLRDFEAQLRAVAAERREAERLKHPPLFEKGQIVHVAGAFEGLDLEVVEANTGKLVEVSFPGWPRSLHISAWNLNAVQLNTVV